jgi:TM2 domain-containing membrane protein YozV
LVKSGCKFTGFFFAAKNNFIPKLARLSNRHFFQLIAMTISKLYFSLLLLILFLPSETMAQGTDSVLLNQTENTLSILANEDTLRLIESENQKFEYKKSRRFVAALLCLTLGPFGMHRLYLGTTPQVAATYSVTLGGAAILPIIDLMLITFSKDLSRFKNNPHVLMWSK